MIVVGNAQNITTTYTTTSFKKMMRNNVMQGRSDSSNPLLQDDVTNLGCNFKNSCIPIT